MDIGILQKVLLFWGVFFITPGPVWISVMEATRKMSVLEIIQFYLRVFFPVNLIIQFSQAAICVVFIELVSKYFSQIDLLFYILGGIYIAYLAYKTIKSKQSNNVFKLGFMSLALIMLLSPKIWLLFPSGAIIASQLSQNMALNVFVFGLGMLIVSSVMFVVYILIGKLGARILKDNFSFLAFGLLLMFSLFLFNEAFQVGIERWG